MSAPATTAPALPGNDFPDWLSPIVVKELRQGLKSRAFVAIATILQGGMAFMFVLAALSGMQPGGGGVDTLSGFFWFMLWIPLVIFMPGRALQAVVEETKVQTLELVQMTRMRSLRIVFGKWLALTVQSLLLVLAILPYFVLRYFFGGVNLAGDLANLASLLAASLVLTAAGLAASTLKPGLRIVLVVVSVMFLAVVGQMIAMMSIFAAFGRGSPLGGFSWPGSVWMGAFAGLVLVAAYVYFFLLQAAEHLSTQAESYSPKKRVLALVSVLAVFAVWMLHPPASLDFSIFVLLMPLVLWSIVEALVESNDPDWFTGRGRFLFFLNRPGWASGLFFALAILAVIYGGIRFGNSSPHIQDLEIMSKSFVIFIGAVITPALMLTRMRRVRQRMLLYWLIQFFFALIFVVTLLISNKPGLSDETVLVLLAPLPPSAALSCLQQEFDHDFIQTIFPITAGVTGVLLLLFLVSAVQSLRSAGRQGA